MGSFDLWRGNLGQMRGDSPGGTAPTPQNGANSERFLQTLAVSRAFDRMPSKCAEVLRLAYTEGLDVHQMANELSSSVWYTAEQVDNCTQRLFAVAAVIYEELSQSTDDSDEAEAHSRSGIAV